MYREYKKEVLDSKNMTVEIKSSQQKKRKTKLELKYNKNQKDGS